MVQPAIERSILSKFASIFGQDYDLYGNGLYEDAQIFYNSISEENRLTLVVELRAFLLEGSAKTDRDYLRSWTKLGASYWPDEIDIQEGLKRLLHIFEGKVVIPVDKNERFFVL